MEKSTTIFIYYWRVTYFVIEMSLNELLKTRRISGIENTDFYYFDVGVTTDLIGAYQRKLKNAKKMYKKINSKSKPDLFYSAMPLHEKLITAGAKHGQLMSTRFGSSDDYLVFVVPLDLESSAFLKANTNARPPCGYDEHYHLEHHLDMVVPIEKTPKKNVSGPALRQYLDHKEAENKYQDQQIEKGRFVEELPLEIIPAKERFSGIDLDGFVLKELEIIPDVDSGNLNESGHSWYSVSAERKVTDAYGEIIFDYKAVIDSRNPGIIEELAFNYILMRGDYKEAELHYRINPKKEYSYKPAFELKIIRGFEGFEDCPRAQLKFDHEGKVMDDSRWPSKPWSLNQIQTQLYAKTKGRREDAWAPHAMLEMGALGIRLVANMKNSDQRVDYETTLTALIHASRNSDRYELLGFKAIKMRS